MVTRAHCMRFVGQHVVFHTTDGITHHGILHSVTDDGIYVRSLSGGTTRLVSDTEVNTINVELLQNVRQSADDVNEVFFPFSFFPFFGLGGLGPWGWWW